MPSTPTTYEELVLFFVDLINVIIPTIFGCLFVYFVWKMIDAWVLHAGDEKSREEGKRYAVTAVIVFVVMVSAWGIVAMIKQSIFG
ncbi:hypothetical protein H6781_01895 [Candidatus Nomurabacteria bacterium]|nr:hypothetical protein [Candidatus Kaiserbacteria bacterium]MCB9810326.1 hypothetical protein [Candidatus Nomurabacteria bacterium]MCB9818465.1 hypothetical protein [Candidatus Nomurabacteria bacterium]